MSFVEQRLIGAIIAGIIVAIAFPIGALIATRVQYSASKRAFFAAFGAGIFFSAIMLLIQQTLNIGNVYDLVLGFGLGAVTFGLAEHLIKHGGVTDSNGRKKNREGSEGKLAIIGTILDSVPETLFVGILIALQEPGLLAVIIVLFLGNLATTLEGAKIMHYQGIGDRKILKDWLADFIIVAVAAPIGYFLARFAVQDILAIVLGFASGTLIVFIAGELIARAYRESTGHLEDFSISLGFLVGVILLFVI